MDNGNMTYNHNGIIFRYNEDEILSFVSKWIELDSIMLSEITRHKEISITFSLYVGTTKATLK